jgi:hypothetical protein
MNERIRELMTEAGMLYTLDSKPTHIDENGTHTFQEINVYKNFDPEKFAELIVRECLNIVEPDEDSGDEWDKGVRWAANQIKEHFGVEE